MENYTKKAIQKQFLELLNEQPLSQITVKSVIERCDMNRNTFYYHFADLNDLLASTVREWLDEALAEGAHLPPLDCVTHVLGAFAQRRQAVLNVYQSVKRDAFIADLERIIDYAAARYLDEKAPGSSKTDKGRDTVRLCRCLFVGLALDWLNSGMNYDLTEFVTRARTLFLSSLEA